jgi:mRNA interferase RelE/StbE
MKILFENSFARDIKRIKQKEILTQIEKIIDQIQTTSRISEIQNLKKLKGYERYYRIRMGEYRIGIEIIENELIFVRFLHRKEIYRFFP